MMRKFQKVSVFFIALFFIASVFIPTSLASFLRKYTFAEMICKADLILTGVVSNVEIVSVGGGDFRMSTIEVTEVIKRGKQENMKKIIEKSPAALHGDHPWYKEGETVVAFLHAIQSTNIYETVGLSQGKIKVVDGWVSWPEKLRLEDLILRIRKHLDMAGACDNIEYQR